MVSGNKLAPRLYGQGLNIMDMDKGPLHAKGGHMSTVFESISLKGLRLTHLRQLQDYIDIAGESGIYWGNREYFWVRHADLKKWIDNAVQYAESEGVVLPK